MSRTTITHLASDAADALRIAQTNARHGEFILQQDTTPYTLHAVGKSGDLQTVVAVRNQGTFGNIGGAPTQANFNALLGVLRSAGIIS